MYQSSSLLRLPPEVQIVIGHWVSRLGNGNAQNRTGNTFLSNEIYNFRLVSKKLASVGASVIALHARNTPHSSYKSILFDFTEQSLQVLQAVSKQREFTASISSVYFILWRFERENLHSAIESARAGRRRDTFNDVELVERWQQRQQFFQSDGLSRLMTVLLEFTNLSNYKWIENDCSVSFFSRRPGRYTSSVVAIPERHPEDTFTRMLTTYYTIQQRIDCLSFIFGNLTHLHLLGTVGPVSWSTDQYVWEHLVDDLANLTCLRLEHSINAQNASTVLQSARLPSLKKLILRFFQGTSDGIDRKLLVGFFKKHASTLKNIQLAYLGLSDVELCHLLVEMRKLVSGAKVSVLYHNHHQDLMHAAVDDRMRSFLANARGVANHDYDYGRCVMKSTVPTSPYDESPSKATPGSSKSANGDGSSDEVIAAHDSDGSSTIHLDDDESADEMDDDADEIDDDGMGHSDDDDDD